MVGVATARTAMEAMKVSLQNILVIRRMEQGAGWTTKIAVVELKRFFRLSAFIE